MEKQTKMFKRVLAFVAAISVISGTNYSAVKGASAELRSKNVKTEPSEEDVQEDNTTTTTDVNQTTTVTNTTTTSTTTSATTTTEPDIDKTITITIELADNPNDAAYEMVVNDVAGYLGSGFEKKDKSLTFTYKEKASENNSYNNVVNNVENYTKSKVYDQGEYIYRMTYEKTANNGIKIMSVCYHKTSFDSNCAVSFSDAFKSSDKCYDLGSCFCVKKGTTLSVNDFRLNDGYYLEAEDNADTRVNGKVTVSNNSVRIAGNKCFSVKKKVLYLDFSLHDTDIKIDNTKVSGKSEQNWVELNKRIVIDLENDKSMSINGKEVNQKIDLTLEQFLYTYADGFTKDYSTSTYSFDIYTSPLVIKAGISYQPDAEGLVSEEEFAVRNKKMQIPKFKKDSEGNLYYLSSCILYKDEKIYPLEDILDSIFDNSSSLYYAADIWKDEKKAESVSLTYTRLDSSSELTGMLFGKMENVRSEGVYALDNDSMKYSFNVAENAPLLEDKFVYFVYKAGNETALLHEQIKGGEYSIPLIDMGVAVDNIEYFEYLSVMGSDVKENPTVYTAPESVILYVDNDEPTINNVTDEYDEHSGWSNKKNSNDEGVFIFNFNVNDDAYKGENLTDKEKKINENPDLASISKIVIGGYTFEKPENGWGDTPVVSKESDEKNLPYDVELIPIKDGNVFSGDFKAVVTLKNSKETFNETLIIKAYDAVENCSEEKSVEVKIDIAAPTADSITIEKLRAGLNSSQVLEKSNNLCVKANIADQSEGSGIVSAKYGYDNFEPVEKKLNSDNSKEAQESKAEFDVLRNKNIGRKGKISITLTDLAGNQKTYYYSAVTENKVSDINNATEVIADNLSPMAAETAPDQPSYTDDSGRKWYGKYPDIFFNVKENGRKEKSSQVEKLTAEINGSSVTVYLHNNKEEYQEGEMPLISSGSVIDSEIIEALESDSKKFYITFKQDMGDSQNFVPYIGIKGTDIKSPLFSSPLSLQDGKLSVKITSVDFAGNESEGKYEEFYVDNNAPELNGTFAANDMRMTRFGTFSNHISEIIVPFTDSDGISTSGIKSAVLSFCGEKYNGEINHEIGIIVFRIPKEVKKDEVYSGNVSVEVIDNVGNSSGEVSLYSVKKNGEQYEALNSKDVIIETVDPKISEPKTSGDNYYRNEKGEEWYSSDISVVYDVNDADSGLYNVKYVLKHENEISGSSIDRFYADNDEKKTEESYLLTSGREHDGKCEFSIDVFDNAGNSASDTIVRYKDISDPYITGFKFENSGAVYERVMEGLNISSEFAKKFSHFFNNSTVITVYAGDSHGASAGIREIHCVLYNTDGSVYNEFVSGSDLVRNPNGSCSYSFSVPEGFKGDVKAWTIDNVNNKSEVSFPDGIASENKERHDSSSVMKIELPETGKRDADGLPLYNKDVTAVLEAKDTFSGIKTVEWQTSDFEGWKKITIDSDGRISGNADGWEVKETERNLAVAVSRSITVSKDANADFICIRLTDNSGNVTEKKVDFSIDKQSPVIEVSGISASPEKKYYNTDKTAHVVISERNYSDPDINGKAESGFRHDDAGRNTDNYKHTKDIVYNQDGTYNINMSDTDLAGNASAQYASGQFVIDKTKPVMNVDIIGADGKKVNLSASKYIPQSVRVEIDIRELNFDSSRISISVNNEKFTPDKWSGSGDIHSAEIPVTIFAKDGKYSIRISGTDLAGNAVGTYEASFTIDTKKPEVKINGVSEANKGEVAPVITISDSNFKSEEIALFRNGVQCKAVYNEADETYTFKINENGKSVVGKAETINEQGEMKKVIVFDNFPKEECYDGAYTLAVSTTDMALNSKSSSVDFTVNRFGSVFTIEGIDEINGKYLNKAPTLSITEINVDKHKEHSDIVIILDKGSSTIELNESDYSVSEPVQLDDNSGYKYTYTVFDKNFDQDVDYSLSIQTEDNAGNKNVSANKGAELSFILDTHEPDFKCDDLIENSEFREQEKEFRLNANEKLSHIKITTDQDEVLLDADVDEDSDNSDNSYTFTIPALNKTRKLTVELTDLAGNKTVRTYDNLLITENIVLYMVHKTWVKIAGGVLGAGIIGAVAFIRLKRKRRY